MAPPLGANPAYRAAAEHLGQAMAARGLGLVYGGASVGLMGTLADSALAAGGEVIGVIPQALVDKEVAHAGLTTLHVTANMHERKARMAELSSGFIAMPGGLGTLEELFEVWTWAQLGLHAKPLGLLNTLGFYDGLLRFLRTAAGEGFLSASRLGTLAVESEPDTLLTRMSL